MVQCGKLKMQNAIYGSMWKIEKCGKMKMQSCSTIFIISNYQKESPWIITVIKQK